MWTAALVLTLALPAFAHAASVLRAADIRILIRSDDACDVTMTLTVDGGGPVDHRIEAAEHTQIYLSTLRGARQVQEPRTIGRIQSLVVEPSSRDYELAYSVTRPSAQDRCPLWVPVAPADGVARAVRISVELPPGMSSRGTMPAFVWSGSTGTTTLRHIPAFVRVPYAPPGESPPFDIAAIMDAAAVLVFAAATGIWIWRRKR